MDRYVEFNPSGVLVQDINRYPGRGFENHLLGDDGQPASGGLPMREAPVFFEPGREPDDRRVFAGESTARRAGGGGAPSPGPGREGGTARADQGPAQGLGGPGPVVALHKRPGALNQNGAMHNVWSAPPHNGAQNQNGAVHGLEVERKPLACHYNNKAPLGPDKGLTEPARKGGLGDKTDPKPRYEGIGSVLSPNGQWEPRYIRACRNDAWSLRLWRKDDPKTEWAVPFRCHSWRHKGDCARWKGAQDFVRIRSVLTKTPEHWTYIVLTFNQRTWKNSYQAYKGLYSCWDKLRKRLKRKFGEYKYIALCEQHRNGWPHLNLLIRSEKLSAACKDDAWKTVRKQWLEPHAVACGFGFRTWIEPVRSAVAMAGYTVKLMGDLQGEMSKLNQAPVKAPKNFRRLRCSQALLPPIHKSGEITGELAQQPVHMVEAGIEWHKQFFGEDFGVKKEVVSWETSLDLKRENERAEKKKTQGITVCLRTLVSPPG